MRYDVHTLVIIDGITWVDPEDGERRRRIRALIENRWRPHLFVMPIRNFRTNNPERILNPVNDQVVACYAQAVDRVEVCQPDY